MQITKTPADGAFLLTVAGRLDGYWADHLDNALSEAVRDGHHHLRVDLSQVTFLSSAGIAALMKFYKQLSRITGTFVVVNPSSSVRLVLEMTRLSAVLIAPDIRSAVTVAMPRPGRAVARAGVAFEVFDRPDAAGLRCRTLGADAPLGTAAFTESDCTSLGSLSPMFALGVGAFGEGFADCQSRFGEMLSVAGATGYQPADGTNVPDYLLATGPLPDDVRVLYGLACEGEFTKLVHFESQQPGSAIGMMSLLEGIAEIVGTEAVGFVMVGEAAGLVGAALRRSPAQPLGDQDGGDFFRHPGVRGRLTFTAERAFLRSTTVTAGVLVRGGAVARAACVRPLGTDGMAGHVHAAAFPFRPLRKGEIDLKDTVTSLFEHEQLLGVLHLLHDDRGPAGAGESEFIRGACWAGPIAADWLGEAKG
ncbi:MAG: STAS domain-containing protein [Acidobacteria bacterium]|jgi:anti-anti-sigma factor|nr:STAS domain-containing protein [Acidobacteriota bacterium]